MRVNRQINNFKGVLTRWLFANQREGLGVFFEAQGVRTVRCTLSNGATATGFSAEMAFNRAMAAGSTESPSNPKTYDRTRRGKKSGNW